MAVPEITLRTIRRFFRQRAAPPNEQQRIEVTVRWNFVTFWESRRPLDDASDEWPRLRRVAQLRYAPHDMGWSVYWWDGRGHWQPWDVRGQQWSLHKALETVDTDPLGVFF